MTSSFTGACSPPTTPHQPGPRSRHRLRPARLSSAGSAPAKAPRSTTGSAAADADRRDSCRALEHLPDVQLLQIEARYANRDMCVSSPHGPHMTRHTVLSDDGTRSPEVAPVAKPVATACFPT